MAEFEDSIVRDLVSSATAVAEELVEQIGNDLKQSISVPSGPGFRSKPGDPPGKETGEYLATIGDDVIVGETSVVFTVFTDSILGRWLEFGTSRMEARPHFRPVADRAAPLTLERCAAGVHA